MPDPRIWPIPSVTDTFATVAAVSTLALAANINRVDTEIVNDGDAVSLCEFDDGFEESFVDGHGRRIVGIVQYQQFRLRI